MRALILAAGFGSRLMPLTKNEPKTMVKYQGKRLIDYELEALRANDIHQIALVSGYLSEILQDYLKDERLIFYKNEKFDRTNMLSSLFCAREFLEKCIETKQDLIVSYGDLVYFKESISKLKETKAEFSICVDMWWQRLWEARFKDILSDAETLKFKGELIKELGKKPKNLSEIEAQYIGLFKFSWDFLPKVIALYESLDKKALYDGKDFDNMYMTSFLQLLIDKFDNARAVKLYGSWCEIDNKSDLDIDIKGL